MYAFVMASTANTIVIPSALNSTSKVAGEIGDSRDSLVLRVIEEYRADLEDARLAEERLEALDAGRSTTVSLRGTDGAACHGGLSSSVVPSANQTDFRHLSCVKS